MVRRSRLTIYFDILKSIEEGNEKPTRIMYGTNLSWNVLNEILETLTKSGFIRIKNGKRRRYKITGKGIRALSYHKKSLEGLIILPLSYK